MPETRGKFDILFQVNAPVVYPEDNGIARLERLLEFEGSTRWLQEKGARIAVGHDEGSGDLIVLNIKEFIRTGGYKRDYFCAVICETVTAKHFPVLCKNPAWKQYPRPTKK